MEFQEPAETIQVQREELRIEREPITDAGPTHDAPALSEEEHEVVLHADEPVIEKRAVPMQRVVLGTEVAADDTQITKDLSEKITLATAVPPARDGDTQRFQP